MKVRYDGQRVTATKSRMAVISYDWKKEDKKIANMVETLKAKGWDCDVFDEIAVIGVSDRDEYERFVEDYKEAKKNA